MNDIYSRGGGGDDDNEDATALPIYASMVGPLKGVGYVEEGRLSADQMRQVERMGNRTDGKYVWNVPALERLLALNSHIVGDASVADFVRRIMDRSEPIDDPNLLCLVHAAFLDHRYFETQECRNTALLLPPDVARYLDDAIAHGPNLTSEQAWVAPQVAQPEHWPYLLGVLDDLQVQIDECRGALYART